MNLEATLFNMQHHKVGIEGKVEQFKERSYVLLHLSVVANKKGTLRLPSTKADNFTYLQGSSKKFPDVFRMGTFIYSTHMKL